MTDEDKQQDEKEDVCPKCGGRGSVPLTEEDPEYQRLQEKYGNFAEAYMTERVCECAKEDRFRDRVGELIFNTKDLEKSQFDDLLDDNMFITSYQDDFLPHLKHALKEGPWESLFLRQTTDSELRDVFVGNNEDYKGLNEFAGKPDLLVIYLGVLSYQNKAMDGVILESLRARAYQAKPTWIVNPPNKPFKDGHLAYGPELDLYIENRFKQAEIRTNKKKHEQPVSAAKDADDMVKNLF